MKIPETYPIVCGTDFSKKATDAVRVASALAACSGSPLIVAHSVDERGEFPESLRARLMLEDGPRFAKETARLREMGFEFEEKLLGGIPDEGLVNYARDRQARFIVVGPGGSGAMNRVFMGNIPERIAETSPLPTFVVRNPEPLLAWARGERPLRVFVATDFSETSDAALEWVAQWQAFGPCHVTLGFIDRSPEERGELATMDALGLTAERPEVRAELEKDLRNRGAEVLGANPEVCVEPGSARVDEHLLTLATQASADLFVLGTHQRHGFDRVRFGSISRHVLRDATVNVCCVPVPAARQSPGGNIPRLSRVLLATDFSEHANRAIPHAYSVLTGEGSVCLLHCAKYGQSDPHDVLRSRLEALIPEKAASRGIASEVRIVETSAPATTIREQAAHFGADLICLGSHGRSAFAAAILGSVAQEVTSHSALPVLIVRPPLS